MSRVSIAVHLRFAIYASSLPQVHKDALLKLYDHCISAERAGRD